MHRTHIQGIIEYVDNNVNTEPGRDMETYSGYLYNYVGNKVDTLPEYLYIHILGSYRAIKFRMFLRIKICKKDFMISLQYYGESGDNANDEITITEHLVTYTMLIDITVYLGLWNYTG